MRTEMYAHNFEGLGLLLAFCQTTDLEEALNQLAESGWTLPLVAKTFQIKYEALRRLVKRHRIVFLDGRSYDQKRVG
jgi:hypothetical protein